METKKFIQFGTLPVIIFGILLTLFSFNSFDFGFSDTSGLLYICLSALMLICLLTFYRIVIEVTENQISFKLGIGLFKKTYQINDLTSCTPVRCSLLNGFGIRRIANGWLYNISGLDAIELRFEDKRNIIQIGTNKSDEIASLVSSLIKQTNSSSQIEYTSSTNWVKWIFYVVVSIILIVSFYFTERNEHIVTNKYNLDIPGIYSKSIDYSQIIKIDTISTIPNIELKTNGSFSRNRAKGYFRLKDVGSAYLNLNLKYPPFIRIVLRDESYVFINSADSKETIELFRNIENRTLKNK